MNFKYISYQQLKEYSYLQQQLKISLFSVLNITVQEPDQDMSLSQKQLLIQQLQRKKNILRELQDKCELQNKKIKLFRKQNQDLTNIIQQRNQIDTNLLLHSKQLLTNNNKLQTTIQQLKQQLSITIQNQQQNNNLITNNHLLNQSINNNNQTSSSSLNIHNSNKKKSIHKIISIKDVTITENTYQLDLPNSELHDQQLSLLQHFTQLKTITLNENLLTNQSILFISSNFILLQKLNLANNKFQSHSLSNISNLKHLKILDIRNNNLGDQALKYISSLNNLSQLSCSKNLMTDKGASYLPQLINLTYLDITNNQLTQQSSHHLNKLQKVTHLYLMSNKLNKDGIIQIIKNSKKLQFLDVRFNVWTNEQKQLIKSHKNQRLQIFC